MKNNNYEMVERTDTAKQKRVELHLHTQLSEDISVITPREAIDYAGDWHHSAIAFTSLNSVQDFVEIGRYYKNCDNKDLKIIYGAEVFFEDEDGRRGCRLTLLAKNQDGIKALYKIISSIQHDGICGFVPIDVIKQNRSNLLVGSCGNVGDLFLDILFEKADETIEKTALRYDYLEIFPTCDPKEITVNRQIYALGERLGIPVVAAGNCHYIFSEDEICVDVVKTAHGQDCVYQNLCLRTTDEMLTEFSYLGADNAYKTVVTNTNLIADLIDKNIKPLKEGCHYVTIDGAAEQISEKAYKKACELYGSPLPPKVKSRLEAELFHLRDDFLATQYLIAHKIVVHIKEKGFSVSNRGAAGSVLVTFLLGIGETNPLPPHYYCPHCHYSDFNVNAHDGTDLPDKSCPVCNKPLKADGHNIAYQTFMGYYGAKAPIIDLSVPTMAKKDGIDFIHTLFGDKRTMWAGTVSTISEYYADLYIEYYEKKTGNVFTEKQRYYIRCKLLNVKNHEGRHPAGIMVLPDKSEFEDFTPVRECYDESAIKHATHFNFLALLDSVIKLDVLGNTALDILCLLKQFTGISPDSIKLNSPELYKLFENGDTLGIPSFDSKTERDMLKKTRPQNFYDLIKLIGLYCGENVWVDNGEALIEKGHALADLPSLRDDVMLDFINIGTNEKLAYDFSEIVRKGMIARNKVDKNRLEKFRRYCNRLGDWYFDFCSKVKYMFPKSHAVSTALNAVRCAYFKIHHPVEFYAAVLSAGYDNDTFDYSVLLRGSKAICDYLADLSSRQKTLDDLYQYSGAREIAAIAKECINRGITFLPPDSNKSHLIDFSPENNAIRLPMCEWNLK